MIKKYLAFLDLLLMFKNISTIQSILVEFQSVTTIGNESTKLNIIPHLSLIKKNVLFNCAH